MGFNGKKQLTLLSIPALAGIIFGVWQFDDRYVSASELEESLNKIYLQIYITEQRILLQNEFEFIKLVEENPGNEELRATLVNIRAEKKIVRERIAERLN